MATFNFELRELPPEAEALRRRCASSCANELAEPPRTSAPRSWGGFDREFSAEGGRARLDRHDVAEAVRRSRAHASSSATSCWRRCWRRARRCRAHWVADRQSGPAAAALRHRGAAAALPAAHRARRAGLRHRDERARLGLGPRLHPHARREGAGRLQGQRHQGLDEQRAPLRLHDRALPHPGRAGQEARGAHAVPRRPQDRRASRSGRSSTSRAGTTSTRWTSRTRFVPEDMRVGEEGDGWKQVTTELAFERSGPERYLS